MTLNPIIFIPSRLGATRLPNKPLVNIHGEPMIVHVWRRGMAANIGPVIVACCGSEIGDEISKQGGWAVVTDPQLTSGTDRIHAALQSMDGIDVSHDVVINLQGDLPTISAALLHQVLAPLADHNVDIATLAAPITNVQELSNANVVKIAMTQPRMNVTGTPIGRALYFSRSPIPSEGTVHYHHIGVYAYRRKALEAFVALPQSSLEKAERLEQLRALEAGMRIDVAIVKEIPPSVDTQEDLDVVRHLLK